MKTTKPNAPRSADPPRHPPVSPSFLRAFASSRYILPALAFTATACTAPPSVAPLLDASRRLALESAAAVEADATLDDAYADQARARLTAAFNADLQHAQDTNTLNADWARDAVAVYTLALDAVTEQAHRRAAQRADRVDRLQTAALLNERAAALLTQRDALIRRALPDLPTAADLLEPKP